MSARSSWVLGAAVLAALLAFPLVVASQFLISFAVLVLFSAFLGQSWNVMGGYGGQFSFGSTVFFGTGAYVSTILQMQAGVSPWIGIFLAAGAGALVGGIIGALSFRFGLRGSYFALITLAFAEAFRILANSIPITGMGVGLLIPLDQRAANFQFADRAGYYYVVLVLALISLAVAWWLERSRFGAQLVAVRENEDAAEALGVSTYRVKVTAVMIAGAMGGAGGTFYTQYFLYIDPSLAYGVERSVEMLLVPIIGGMGTALGPFIGAFALHTIGEVTRHVFPQPGLALMIYGAILVLIVGFLPNGLIGLLRLATRGAANARR